MVHVVESLGKSACHLQMLLLVFAHRHLGGFVYQYVGSHKGWIGQQPGVHVVGVLAHLILKRGHPLQLAKVGIHVEKEVQFYGFRQVALKVQCSLVGVEAAGQILHQYLTGIAI